MRHGDTDHAAGGRQGCEARHTLVQVDDVLRYLAHQDDVKAAGVLVSEFTVQHLGSWLKAVHDREDFATFWRRLKRRDVKARIERSATEKNRTQIQYQETRRRARSDDRYWRFAERPQLS